MTCFVVTVRRALGRTFERNVRIGGFRTEEGWKHAAVKHAPCLVKDEHRNIVGQTVCKSLPNYLEKDRKKYYWPQDQKAHDMALVDFESRNEAA